ncbi:hypothetical protein GUITHDRAFT_41107, partial [Guillardia theta CCMP2712]
VLVFLCEGFEEIETVSPIDILRRAGAQVTVASLTKDLHVKGRSNIIMSADVDLDAVKDQDFDCVLCPGGPGTKHLREDARVISIVQRHHQKSVKLAAICAAPTVLHQAGVLGSKYTAHFSVKETIPDIMEQAVVVDGNIITSRGAGTATEFGLAVVRELISKEKSDEVAK